MSSKTRRACARRPDQAKAARVGAKVPERSRAPGRAAAQAGAWARSRGRHRRGRRADAPHPTRHVSTNWRDRARRGWAAPGAPGAPAARRAWPGPLGGDLGPCPAGGDFVSAGAARQPGAAQELAQQAGEPCPPLVAGSQRRRRLVADKDLVQGRAGCEQRDRHDGCQHSSRAGCRTTSQLQQIRCPGVAAPRHASQTTKQRLLGAARQWDSDRGPASRRRWRSGHAAEAGGAARRRN